MKKKLLVSVLSSLAIVVAAVSVAYAFGTFKANQFGFRQGGAGQAAEVTMRVEAGLADANSALLPDTNVCAFNQLNFCAGGALSFSITNTSEFPLRVTGITLATSFCIVNGQAAQCPMVTSNKNSSGQFVQLGANGAPSGATGDCAQYVVFLAPAQFDNWPTIGPRSILQVNGTDNNQLGAGMLHLKSTTPDGCQGATFALGLNVSAVEAAPPSSGIAPNP